MSERGTASEQVITGWYIEFQLAALRALPRDISQEIADGWRNNGEALAKAFHGILMPASEAGIIVPSPLLKPAGTGTLLILATVEPFITRDRFIVNTGRKAKVKISYIGENFRAWFLEKVEESFGGSTLCSARLRKGSVDGPIIAELGGEQKAETTLAEMFALMERQRNGQGGSLLTNGYANIFYVRDKNCVLRAVSVDWGGGGWDVYADSVADPYKWHDDDLVFSRNSVS